MTSNTQASARVEGRGAQVLFLKNAEVVVCCKYWGELWWMMLMIA